MCLVPSFLDLPQPLSWLMTCPTFDSFLTVLSGWVFARRRTVTGMILAAGAVGQGHKHHSAYHRLFAAARWSLDELGLAVFGLMMLTLPGAIIFVAVDDTPVPQARPQADVRRRHAPRPAGQLQEDGGVQLGPQLGDPGRRHLAALLPRPILLPAGPVPPLPLQTDRRAGGQGRRRLLHPAAAGRADAEAAVLPPPRPPLPRPGGHGLRRAERAQAPAGQLRPDQPAAVAAESLKGSRCVRAYYSTVADATAEQVLDGYAMRFSVEQTIQEAKGQLGFEQPQNWTKPAVRRTAPVAMLLYSLVVLWFAREGHRHYAPPHRPWYRTKAAPSFADMLATLRCRSAAEAIAATPHHGQPEAKSMETLMHLLKQAA